MKFSLQKELTSIAIIAVPCIYLIRIWHEMPAVVPTHWNIHGEIDGYGSKLELALIALLIPILTYLAFLIFPYIDPKGKLKNMGGKYKKLQLLLVLVMSILAFFILHSSKNQSLTNLNYVTLAIGLLYIVLGNYFKTIRANYFIGIRTPWTLEDETVWKKTHKLAGILWFVGGSIIVLSSMIISKTPNFILFSITSTIIVIVPVTYSYFTYKKLKSLSL